MRSINKTDIGLALFFALVSALMLAGRWQHGDTDLYLKGDAANIATFAAALDHPENFAGDGVLGDPGSFEFYLAAHIPVIRWLARIWGGYGMAFVSLLAPHVFLHLLGFYILGRVLFTSRSWAFLLSAITFARLDLHVGTFWGMYDDAIPRVTFQVILPFLLASAIHWRNRPGAWPLVMAGAGLLTYIHPVSAPVWGLVIWLGFVLSLPQEWGWRRRTIRAAVTGAAFLVVISPWIAHYLQTFEYGRTADYNQVREAMAFRFIGGTLDPLQAVLDFVLAIPDVLVIGIGAILFVWHLDPASRSRQRILHIWLVALVGVSVAIPVIDHAFARAYGTTHFEIDLIRNLRYAVPLLMVFWIWCFSAWNRTDPGFSRPAVVGLILALSWTGQHSPALLVKALKNLSVGTFTEEDPVHASFRRAVKALQETTSPREPVLATFAPVHVRYGAQRAVVYTFKDGGILSYSNHAEMIRWHQKALNIREVEAGLSELKKSGEWDTIMPTYDQLASSLGASILFLRVPDDASLPDGEILYRKEGFVITRVPGAG